MLKVDDIKHILEVYAHSKDMAAERVYTAVANSLITFNPINASPQTPFQVKAERDSLLFSNKSLLSRNKSLKTTARNYRLTIKKLRAKLDLLSVELMNEKVKVNE